MRSKCRAPGAAHLDKSRRENGNQEAPRNSAWSYWALLATHERDAKEKELERQAPGDHAEERDETARAQGPDRTDPIRAGGRRGRQRRACSVASIGSEGTRQEQGEGPRAKRAHRRPSAGSCDPA